MDEEELEGLLPRTDLDNASQGTVSTQDALLGTPINAPAGVGRPSNKVSIPSFGQPGAGLMPAMPAMTPVGYAAPAVETYEDYFRPVTTLESQPLTPSEEADLFGSKALDDAMRNGNLKETELVTMVPSTPLTEQEKMSLAQPIDTQPLSESEKADLLEMQGLDNLRQNGADTLMGALKFPDSGLDRILPSEPLTANESSDLFAQQRLDEMRRNGPQNLAEAVGPQTSNGSSGSITMGADGVINLEPITRSGTPFEASALMPDGSTRGYLIGGGSRTMSPEEKSQYDQYSDTILAPEQAVPGTDGFVRFPKAPVATAPAIAPATEQPVPVQPNPAAPVAPVAPAEQAVSAPRALTTADVENPAFAGMSAAEKIAAVNTPGYQSPDLAPIPAGGGPQSKFDQFSEKYTDFYAKSLDLPLSLGRLLVSPNIMTKDYLLGTEDNKNPTLRELGSERYDAISETPISDFVSGRRAQKKAGQAASEQDQRNRDFFAQNPGVQYQDGVRKVKPIPLTPEEMNDFMGAEGSPQRYFMDRMVDKGELTDQEIAAGYQFADRNKINFDPQSGFSQRPATLPPEFSNGLPQIERGPYRPNNIDPGLYQQPPSNINDFLNRNPSIVNKPAPARPDNYGVRPLPQYNTPPTLENYRSGGQTLGQFMRYEDQPVNRTEQFLDPQGRLRYRLTPQASAMQGNPAGVQPLAPQYSSYEADAAAREARLRDREDQAANDRNNRSSVGVEDGRRKYSNSDLKKIFGRGAEYKRAKALLDNGYDPVTKQPISKNQSDAKTAELRQRILEAEAIAKERGEDPSEVRQRILNNQLLEERISELRRKGLPDDITFRKGEFGTIVVQKGGRDISYFKEDVDLEEQMRKLGNLPGGNGNGNGNTVDSGSGNTVRMIGRNNEPRDVPKDNVQEALQNGYTIK